MIPFNYKNFNYKGISIPSESPFFPTILSVGKEDAVVNFNQGYVFNINDVSLSQGGAIENIVVYNMDQNYTVADQDIFYVKLTTYSKCSPDNPNKQIAIVQSAELIQKTAEEGEPEKEGNIVYIKVCEFKAQGEIKEIYLRENIFWSTNERTIFLHPWQVSKVCDKPDHYNIRAGVVFGKGGSITIPSEFNKNVEANNLIYLQINLSPTGDLINGEFKTGLVVPVDTATEIYREIAIISADGQNFVQLAFEPIRLNDGDTFIVEKYNAVITVDGAYFEQACIPTVTVEETLAETFYVQRGLWHLIEPVGFPVGAIKYKFTYIAPTEEESPPE
jgi:hypothetical protein